MRSWFVSSPFSPSRREVDPSIQQMWPMHKTLCGTEVDYFRVPPLSEEEIKALLLIQRYNGGCGSYPFTNKQFTLREAMTRFGIPETTALLLRHHCFPLLSHPSMISSSPR